MKLFEKANKLAFLRGMLWNEEYHLWHPISMNKKMK